MQIIWTLVKFIMLIIIAAKTRHLVMSLPIKTFITQLFTTFIPYFI